jgi:hypothetical protein
MFYEGSRALSSFISSPFRLSFQLQKVVAKRIVPGVIRVEDPDFHKSDDILGNFFEGFGVLECFFYNNDRVEEEFNSESYNE